MSRFLIATDIFGITKPALELCEELGRDYVCVGPYEDSSIHFDNEFEAYDFFIRHTSIEQYASRLDNIVRGQELRDTVLIGFSAGAAALWYLAANYSMCSKSAIVGLYGGQIRHYADMFPAIPTRLIFPHSEPHFEVDQLAQALNGAQNVQVSISAHQHGFMNRYSAHFDEGAYNTMTKQLTHWIKEHQLSAVGL